jgi:hypothetical protein
MADFCVNTNYHTKSQLGCFTPLALIALPPSDLWRDEEGKRTIRSVYVCALLSAFVILVRMNHAKTEQRSTNYPSISYVTLELALRSYREQTVTKWSMMQIIEESSEQICVAVMLSTWYSEGS